MTPFQHGLQLGLLIGMGTFLLLSVTVVAWTTYTLFWGEG